MRTGSARPTLGATTGCPSNSSAAGLAITALLLTGCAAPDGAQLFTQADWKVVTDPVAADAAFIDVVDSAETELAIALPAGADIAVSDAILAAADRGVDVEVVADNFEAGSPAIAALIDGAVEVQLADGDFSYFEFTTSLDVDYSDEIVRMSHAYAVADRERAIVADSAGSLDEGTRIQVSLSGETLMEDLLTEHVQVFGGTDATAVTAYDELAKSIADPRSWYLTGGSDVFGLWDGPQERLIKRITDAVYAARGSIWVMTDDFANDGLARALQEKADDGFDVRVVVGPHFGDAESALSRILEEDTPDVEKRRVQTAHVPTLVLVDTEEGLDGRHYTAHGMVLTFDLWCSSRLYRGSAIATDQLVDGALYQVDDTYGDGDTIAALREAFLAAFDEGVEL